MAGHVDDGYCPFKRTAIALGLMPFVMILWGGLHLLNVIVFASDTVNENMYIYYTNNVF